MKLTYILFSVQVVIKIHLAKFQEIIKNTVYDFKIIDGKNTRVRDYVETKYSVVLQHHLRGRNDTP